MLHCIDFQIQKTLSDLTNDLAKLELNNMKDALQNHSDIVDCSESSRAVIDETQSMLRGELTTHLLKQNTSFKGLICWLKPGVSLKVNPEPIHLKAALKYVLDHKEFDSTGYHICDIFSEQLDIQYAKIVTFINMTNERKCLLTSELKQISHGSYERLKALYLKNADVGSVDYSKLLSATKAITQTASAVIQDVIDKKLVLTMANVRNLLIFCFN
jgi:hypothetical protein